MRHYRAHYNVTVMTYNAAVTTTEYKSAFNSQNTPMGDVIGVSILRKVETIDRIMRINRIITAPHCIYVHTVHPPPPPPPQITHKVRTC